MSYKRIVIEDYGSSEMLKLREEPELPEPQVGQVRVKVQYTCVNFTDIMVRKGMYPDVKDKPPFSPGYDMVGIVDKNGENAGKFQPGQRVADMTVIGAYSEYICLDEDRLVAVPENVDGAEATAVILSYLTAYQMLFRKAKVKKEQSVLIHGASGAVGIALLQLGKQENLKMWGTASQEKHELVRKYGGISIDYKSEDFEQRLRQESPQGMDVVFDSIGGPNFKKSFRCLRKGGKLVAFGFYNAVMGKGGNIPLEFMKLMMWNWLPNRKSAGFYSIGGLRKKHPDMYKQDLQYLFQQLADGKIKPLIGKKFPLENAAEAHKLIERSGMKGKIVLEVE